MTQPYPHNHDALTLSLPDTLKEIPGWLVHRQKVPYYSNGANRGTNGTPADRANLSTFNDALACLNNGGNYSGLGFATLPEWGIVGLDFDDKQGEGLHPLAAEAERLTYCEISPSGKGRRAFFQGSMPDISLPGKIEIFHGSRYVTVTGNRINTLDIEPLPQDFADKLRAAITGNRTTPGQRQAISQTFIDDKTKAELRSALAAMRADDRDLWQRMGHALKTIGDEGRSLWFEWSQTSEKYNAADASRVWESFKPTSTGHQAVFAEAQRQGWVNPLAGGGAILRIENQMAPTEWPDPVPLPKLPPVPEFEINLLPDDLQRSIGDAADIAKFRPDFAAVASMVGLGSTIGRKLGIRLKARSDWTEYANVWGGLVGPPSALKSPAEREGLRAFKTLQVSADKVYQDANKDYQAEMEAFELKRGAALKAVKKQLDKNPDAKFDLGGRGAPEPPERRTYWTTDANEASLSELLVKNPNGLLIERDELSSLLVNLEDDRNAALRGMLLSGWSGKEGFRSDRIMRGITNIPRYALSIIGGIQPGPLARYVRGAFSGERADGMLQRFQLIVWPDPESFEYVDRWPDTLAKKMTTALFERADTFDPLAMGEADHFGNDSPFVRFTDEAQGRFVEWYTDFMQGCRAAESKGECPAISAHFGKYPGLVGKLSLILHVADDPDARQVSDRTLNKALAWLDYLTPHARRVYHAVEHPETGAAELLLARMRREELPGQFKAWEITRKQWHGLTDREAVKRACRLLYEHGWLLELEQGGGMGPGRPADAIYAVSPKAKGTL